MFTRQGRDKTDSPPPFAEEHLVHLNSGNASDIINRFKKSIEMFAALTSATLCLSGASGQIVETPTPEDETKHTNRTFEKDGVCVVWKGDKAYYVAKANDTIPYVVTKLSSFPEFEYLSDLKLSTNPFRVKNQTLERRAAILIPSRSSGKNHRSKTLTLSEQIKKLISGYRQIGYLNSSERVAILIREIGKAEPLVSINSEVPMRSASMIKPFIVMAFFKQVQQGRLPYTDNDRRAVWDCLHNSNNEATNYILGKIGGPKVAHDILKKYFGDIFKNGRVVEYIPPRGRTYLNSISAGDHTRLLVALRCRKDIYGRTDMLKAMSGDRQPSLRTNSCFIPEKCQMTGKTGRTRRTFGDGEEVKVEHDGVIRRYTVVTVFDRSDLCPDESAYYDRRADLIGKVGDTFWRHVAKLHGYPLALR